MVYWKFNLLGYRLAFYGRRVEYVKGVNSNLDNGKHALLLDVEGISLRQVESEAARMISRYNLGPAQIFDTGRPDSWHVYFLSAHEWKEALRLASSFYGVDAHHLVWSLRRGHFTLRFSTKKGRKIEWAAYVPSEREPDYGPHDLHSFTKYQTSGLI